MGMKIAIGSDHRGFHLKEKLKEFLTERKFNITDAGCSSPEPVDYPDIARAVAGSIISGECERGLIICGSGVGASVAANKFKGIRAAVCHDTFSARQGVEDDSMNVLCMGGGIVGESLAKEIVLAFLNARFKSEEERYVRRLNKVKGFEDSL